MRNLQSLLAAALFIAWTTGFSAGRSSAQEGASAPPAAQLLPHPDAAELQKATAAVADIFQADIEQAKTPAQKQQLAQELIRAARGTKDDPLGRFALLRMGAGFAANGGDYPAASGAIDELARTHQLDALEMKTQAADAASKLLGLPKEHEAFCSDLLPLIDASAQADRYAGARKLAELLVRSAKASRDPKLASGAAGLAADVDELASEFERLTEPLVRRQAGTATAEDKLAVGMFFCLSKGDWKVGLPILAEGSDSPLSRLAASELSAPAKFEDQFRLAESWWAEADRHGSLRTRRIRQHAAGWYESALPKLTGFDEAKARQRIKVVRQEESDNVLRLASPGQARTAARIDLLALAKERPVNQLAVGGSWSRSKDALMSGDSPYGRLALPHEVQGPYRLDVEFTMTSSKDECISIILPVADRHTVLTIDGWSGRGYLTYLCNVKGREAPENPDAVRGKRLKAGKLHAAQVDVSWDDAADSAQVTFTLDGKRVFSWRGKTSDLTPQRGWELPKPRLIGLGTYITPTEFTKATLAEK
jgi:hypothetical protein